MHSIRAILHMPANPLIEVLFGIGTLCLGLVLIQGSPDLSLLFPPILALPLAGGCLVLGLVQVWAALADRLALRRWCARVSTLCWAYVTLVAVLFRIERWQVPFTTETVFFTLHTILSAIIALQLAVECAQTRGDCDG